MNRPTGKNFYGGAKTEEVAEIRALLAKKEEDYKLLLDKYDRLFISNYVIIQVKIKSLKNNRLSIIELLKENCNSCRHRGKLKRRELLKMNNG